MRKKLAKTQVPSPLSGRPRELPLPRSDFWIPGTGYWNYLSSGVSLTKKKILSQIFPSKKCSVRKELNGKNFAPQAKIFEIFLSKHAKKNVFSDEIFEKILFPDFSGPKNPLFKNREKKFS